MARFSPTPLKSFPKVTIVTPTWNRGKQLEESVRNFKNLDYPQNKIEIIFVNDCSTDDTAQVGKILSTKYSNVKMLKTPKNSGPAAARNVGIKNAKGEYLFFTDDDCIVPPHWISAYLSVYFNHKEVAGVSGNVIPPKKNFFAFIDYLLNKFVLKTRRKDILIGGVECPGGFTGNVSYRRKVLVEVGMFNPSKRTGEEQDLKQRVCKKYKMAFVPVSVIHNQPYNLNYFLKQVYEKGVEKTPPKSTFKMAWGIFIHSPKILLNIFRKARKYQKSTK